MATTNHTEETYNYVKEHVVSLEKKGDRKIHFRCDSAKAANSLIAYLNQVWSGISDPELHFLRTDKTANAKFPSNELRDTVYNTLYPLVYCEGELDPKSSAGDVTYKDPITDGSESNPAGATDYTTYIIIGAAVLLIFLLLKRKNKK